MPDPTTNFGWDLPNVGADTGVWGTLLNDIFNSLDTSLGTIQTTANAALPKAGGVLTGLITVLTAEYTTVDATDFSSNLDLALSNFFFGTVTGAQTIDFDNVPASPELVAIMIEITNGGSATVSWAASVDWPSATAPTLTTAGVDVITGYTRDGGATWHLAIAQTDSS